MKRIIIVEDSRVLASNLEKVLVRSTKFQVVGNYPSAEDALEADEWGNADLFLSDLGLPGMQGSELIAFVRNHHPGVLCLVYSLFSDDVTVFEALRAGAQGYILKGCTGDQLIASLISLAQGESPMSPSIAKKLLENFLNPAPKEKKCVLTEREVKIVRLLSEGFLYKEVADRLGVSQHTVHSHIKKIYVKLQAPGRANAVRKARDLGYL